MAKRKPKPYPSRDWLYEKEGSDKIYCFSSPYFMCTVVSLATARRSEFHDAELQAATRQINRILDRIDRTNDDPSRELSFIDLHGRLMLVWVHGDEAVGNEDDYTELAQALKLKGDA